MASETASFTLRFRNEVSRPAAQAARDLGRVRETLVGLDNAGPESALAARRASSAHETAAQRMARENRRVMRSLTSEHVRAQRTLSDPLVRMDEAMAHERWVA